MEEPFSGTTDPDPRPPIPWVPIGIGAAIVAVAVIAVLMLSRPKDASIDPAAAELAKQLTLSDVGMLEAQNMVGGNHTYLEGTITNNSDRTINGAMVQVIFRNQLGEVVDQPREPLLVVLSREPAVDVTRLSNAPLAPGKSREFRLTFEHVSADWNRQLPEIQVISATAQ